MPPRPASARPDREDPPSARFYLCLRCRPQALVCSSCDRGQIYCTPDCAKAARKEQQRCARRRYQAGARGRAMHAERSRRFRERQRGVTDHGSLEPAAASLLTELLDPLQRRSASLNRHQFLCNGCACAVSEFVRLDTLPPRKPVRRRGKFRSGTPIASHAINGRAPPP